MALRFEADRLFTDRMTESFADRIQAKSQERYGSSAVWVRSDHKGPTGKLYTLRRLAVVKDGKVVAVARCNRAGAVYWHEPWSNEQFDIEPESRP